jgi:hypothetical protein
MALVRGGARGKFDSIASMLGINPNAIVHPNNMRVLK